MDPAKTAPTGTFSEHVNQPPDAAIEAAGATFALGLAYDGVPRGYLGFNDAGYCTWTDDAQKFEQYVWSDGKTYLKVIGGTWDGYWLSVSRNAYVGAYGWGGSTDWTFSGDRMTSGYMGADQPLSFYSDDNTYIYCWKDYQVLSVTRE